MCGRQGRNAEANQQWAPRLAGELNGQVIKLAKVEGEFVWYHHDDADELFLVTSGTLRIEFQDEPDVVLHENEFLIIPQGVEYRPIAKEEAEVLLFEPTETRNTGNVETEQTQGGTR